MSEPLPYASPTPGLHRGTQTRNAVVLFLWAIFDVVSGLAIAGFATGALGAAAAYGGRDWFVGPVAFLFLLLGLALMAWAVWTFRLAYRVHKMEPGAAALASEACRTAELATFVLGGLALLVVTFVCALVKSIAPLIPPAVVLLPILAAVRLTRWLLTPAHISPASAEL